ncbi:amino acid ABC transporter ATP-binding protein [Devosia limi]|uniref:Polar amino acid transport system ATP-binding protein n=1 Tax=Devosia limi DSM 17137 TaxID=1121477 RepID=A0A1M5ALR9_9HYPH|nr:polar amino acid transport system ATP-binding protein [Devosia limi DSM 17137]
MTDLARTNDAAFTGPVLQAVNLSKNFQKLQVFQNLSLDLQRGEVVALIGPSGSGKSTFLRCLNMMETPSSGQVLYQGASVIPSFRDRGDQIGIGTLRRNVGMVFQHFNLFPHMTVLQNVCEGPISVKRMPKAEAQALGMHFLGLVGLAEKHDSYPSKLSGGQKQRVAIARALAMQPGVLLLDEVTSALDPELVGEVLDVIRTLAREGITMAIVTHEMAFAADVSSRVLFLDKGRIAAEGSPDEIIFNPSDERLSNFVSRTRN